MDRAGEVIQCVNKGSCCLSSIHWCHLVTDTIWWKKRGAPKSYHPVLHMYCLAGTCQWIYTSTQNKQLGIKGNVFVRCIARWLQGKCTCCQAWQLAFNPRTYSVVRREYTTVCSSPCVYTCTHEYLRHNKKFKM